MKALRIAICALAVFGVLAHGGVEEWALAVFETGAGVLFFLWALFALLFKEKEIVLPNVLPPLLAFAVVITMQLFFRRTASAYDTRAEFQLLLAYIVLVFLAAQAFRSLQDWRDFFWFSMLFGFFVAGFGILQHLTFNGKLYWFREMRYGGIPFGPYVNRNHFAGFAELIIPIALVPLVLGKVRRERRFVVGLFALLPIVALFMSASRGGIVAFGIELLSLIFFIALQRAGSKHLLSGGIVLLAALSLVSWLGVKEVLSRFGSLQTLEVKETKRAAMRHGTWRIFLDRPILGTGLGTFQLVYPPYETLYDGKIVNHAHNDYLETLAETGILGGLCCAWFIALLALAALRSLQEKNLSFAAAFRLAGLMACCGFLVHALVDFNLHIPANAFLFFLMALLATSEMPATQAAAPLVRNTRSAPSP
ncbi:MAG: O-antigen ligase family protein [Acidobacteria bacterium]|nr:O-antigen ligase family protein [Acidobacteriota bacterium]MBS1865494.1 O-antigen ligase family protein [Acidobacteriota bacterium]